MVNGPTAYQCKRNQSAFIKKFRKNGGCRITLAVHVGLMLTMSKVSSLYQV